MYLILCWLLVFHTKFHIEDQVLSLSLSLMQTLFHFLIGRFCSFHFTLQRIYTLLIAHFVFAFACLQFFFLFTSIFRTFSRGTQNSAQKRSGREREREKKQFYSTISNRKQSMEIIAIAGFFCLYCSLFLKIFLLHSFHLCYSTYILLMIICGWSSRKFALNRVSQSLKLFNKNPFVE